ncbi:MAG TPA: hypothetical protein VGK02_06910 [Candidatus Aquicultor sp.]|jgi:cytoskeletal protein CcmA (bactofilin family)
MENENRNDLKISGAGSASGGMYRNVKINGAGSVNGDIDCIDLAIKGSFDGAGNIQAQTGAIHGTLSLRGNLETESFRVAGSADIGGAVSGKAVKVDGSATIGGRVALEELRARGAITIRSDCEAETFAADGAFTIDGLLNAGTIEVKMYGPCQAREIGGENISVKRGNDFGFSQFIKSVFKPSFKTMLTADTIEGDTIYLESTKANVVRGNSVHIGQDCEIELVEYKENYEQASDTRVKEAKKIDIAE